MANKLAKQFKRVKPNRLANSEKGKTLKRLAKKAGK